MLNGYPQLAQEQNTLGKKAAGKAARKKPLNQTQGKKPEELVQKLHFPLAFEISTKDLHKEKKWVMELQSKYHKADTR